MNKASGNAPKGHLLWGKKVVLDNIYKLMGSGKWPDWLVRILKRERLEGWGEKKRLVNGSVYINHVFNFLYFMF